MFREIYPSAKEPVGLHDIIFVYSRQRGDDNNVVIPADPLYLGNKDLAIECIVFILHSMALYTLRTGPLRFMRF